MPFLLSRGCTQELIEKGCSPPVGCEAAIKSHPLTRIEAKQAPLVLQRILRSLYRDGEEAA